MGEFIFELWAFMKERKKFWLLLNPFVHIMDGSRDCLLRGLWPPLWIGLAMVVTGLALSWAGLRWFRSNEKAIVEHIL